MADLAFDCVDVVPERYGAGPTLLFKLRVTETSGQRVHAIALRAQIRIEPARRTYSDHEVELLADVFGARSRWGETLKVMQFAHASVMVPSFTGAVEVDLPVPVSYDLEVATGKFLHALSGDPVPMTMLFSGTVFGKPDNESHTGFWVEPVPWTAEAPCRMPVDVWRTLMDLYFPDSGWLMLRRETLDALTRYKAARGYATWDETVTSLVPEVRDPDVAVRP
jgi:hypothetical protein